MLSAEVLRLDEAELLLEHRKFAHFKSGFPCEHNGAGIEIFSLHRALEIEVEFHTWRVGSHLQGVLNHLIGKSLFTGQDF